MKLTRAQIVLSGILGLGAVGLLCDRFVIGYDAGGPHQASAAVSVAAAGPTSATVHSASGSATPVIATTGTAASTNAGHTAGEEPTDMNSFFAQRLQSVALAADLANMEPVDAFAVAPDSPALTTPAGAPAPRLEAFESRHTLQAVMGDDRGGFAMIDGNIIRLGEMLDGLTLTQLHKRTAVFSSPEGTKSLTLQRAATNP